MTQVSLDRLADAFGMNAKTESDIHQYATVDSVNVDGSYQVQLNGSLTTTRAAKLCNAEIGDRVLCVIHNGQLAAIGSVAGTVLPVLPTVETFTITQEYTGNGFTVEQTTGWACGNVVTVPISFSATSAISWGNQLAASIPAEYAPPGQLRVNVYSQNAWSGTLVPSWINIETDGSIKPNSDAATVWFGHATYVRG